MAENVLYYGDNLEILRRYIKDESVDLVHLDPPLARRLCGGFIWQVCPPSVSRNQCSG